MSLPNLETHHPQDQPLGKAERLKDSSNSSPLEAQLSLELQLRSTSQELLNLYKKSQNWPAVNQLAQSLITGSQRITQLKASLENQAKEQVSVERRNDTASSNPVHCEPTSGEEAQSLREDNQLKSTNFEQSDQEPLIVETIRSDCGQQTECFANEALHTIVPENNREQYTEALAGLLNTSHTATTQKAASGSEFSSSSSSPVKSSHFSSSKDISESNSDLFFSPPESLSLENGRNSEEFVQRNSCSSNNVIETPGELCVIDSEDTAEDDREVELLDNTLLEIDTLLADFVPGEMTEQNTSEAVSQLAVASEQPLINGITQPQSIEQATEEMINAVTEPTVVSNESEAMGPLDCEESSQSAENGRKVESEEQCEVGVIVDKKMPEDDVTSRTEQVIEDRLLGPEQVENDPVKDEGDQVENKEPSENQLEIVPPNENQYNELPLDEGLSENRSEDEQPITVSEEVSTDIHSPGIDTEPQHEEAIESQAVTAAPQIVAGDEQHEQISPEHDVGSEVILPSMPGSDKTPLTMETDLAGTEAASSEPGPGSYENETEVVTRDEDVVETSVGDKDIVNSDINVTNEATTTEQLPVEEHVVSAEEQEASNEVENSDMAIPSRDEPENQESTTIADDETDGLEEVGITNLSNCADIADKLESTSSSDQAPVDSNEQQDADDRTITGLGTDSSDTVDKLDDSTSKYVPEQVAEQLSPGEQASIVLASLKDSDLREHTVKSVSPTNSPLTSDDERTEPLYRSLESSPKHKKVKKRKSFKDRLRKSLTTSFKFTGKSKDSSDDLPVVRKLSPITGTEWDPTCLLEELYSDYQQGANVTSKSGEAARHFGYLQKLPMNKTKATFSKGYKRRYFRAMEGKLYYYEDRTVAKALGFVKLESSRIVPIPESMQIQVVQKDGRSLMLKSADAEDFSTWHKHLLLEAAHPTQSTPGSPLPVQKPNVIIIDVGACSVRAGYATDDAYPELFFPALASLDATNNSDSGCGIAALQPENRYGCHQVYPRKASRRMDQQDGNVKLRALDVIINHIVEILDIDPSITSLILTMPPTVPEPDRNDLVELLFESYGFAGLCIQEQAILALYSYNTTSGLVVDIGDHLDIIPIIDGYVIEAGVIRLPFGGNAITESLSKLITSKGMRYFSETESYVVRLIKEKLCFVSEDYLEDCTECDANVVPFTHAVDVDQYQLADHRKVITLDSARFKAAEGLFTPSHWGKDVSGLHEHVWKSIQACPIDQRKQLAKSIYLSGGTSLMPGLQERLQKELTKLAGPGLGIEVHAGPNRQHAAYIGASVLANLSSFRRVNVITNEEWAEGGVDCLQKWKGTS